MLDAYMRRLHTDEGWRVLTTQQKKFDYFVTDTHFRESWRTAVDVLGTHAGWLMQRIALLTLRPEGIIGRRARQCVEVLARLDYAPLHAHRFRYDRMMIRELWRYQWNVASFDRLAVGDRLHYRTDVLSLVLLDVREPLAIPASSRLSRHKGSAFPPDRRADHLRSQLGAPNRIMVVVHCPDEPMDVVRELGIIFERDTLRQLYAKLAERVATGTRVDPEPYISRLYDDFPARSLSVDDAVREVLAELDRAECRNARTGPAAARARAAIMRASEGQYLDWDRWCADLAGCGVDQRSWAVTVVASEYVQHDVPDARCLISRTGRGLWQAGHGRMLDQPPAEVA
ncbi:hypothetical protein [Catellatospora sichuanensis]|uniref:hypothetical protein n=1 Tax=Catellatospora sichuanensis TaxID=1969805 RepID=UPI001181F4DC|nr:hypothetical protein [Catellatospora sichuanensis]